MPSQACNHLQLRIQLLYQKPGTRKGSYTRSFFETRWSPEAVILSAAKDLRLARREILRCAQDDTSHLAGSFPKKPTRVRTGSPAPTIHGSGRPIRRMVGAGSWVDPGPCLPFARL